MGRRKSRKSHSVYREKEGNSGQPTSCRNSGKPQKPNPREQRPRKKKSRFGEEEIIGKEQFALGGHQKPKIQTGRGGALKAIQRGKEHVKSDFIRRRESVGPGEMGLLLRGHSNKSKWKGDTPWDRGERKRNSKEIAALPEKDRVLEKSNKWASRKVKSPNTV